MCEEWGYDEIEVLAHLMPHEGMPHEGEAGR
jgi:hypothetical protein